MKKKYYDGFMVHDILDKHLEPKKMMEVLTAFAETKGVDVVEVIRCKDCKYAKMTIGGDEAKYCRKIIEELEYTDSVYLDKDFFCAWAERKEE